MKESLFSRSTVALAAGLALTLVAGPAFAQEVIPEAAPAAAEATETLSAGDTAWMLTSTVIVLMMAIPGLALFYAGMTRKKNVLNTVAMVFAAVCVLSVTWFVIGYSIAFGDGGAFNAYTGGLDKLFLGHLTKDALSGTIPESLFIVFQMTFFAITPALIVGSIVERMKFSSLLVFLVLWSLIVYAPICHWVWGGGFLSEDGVLDFAGGTVVHINSGVAGLVAALVLGRRKGYGTENLAPHNLVLTMIGASLLWVGWFGFNAGSAAAADDSASMAALVTQIAAAAGGLTWMIAEWIFHRKPTILGVTSGAIAGLVGITPAAGFVDPMGGLFIGIGAGFGAFFFSTAVKKALGYDESLDVFGIHGIGGIVGAVLTGVFAVEAIGGTAGLLEGNFAQVWIQIYGIIATIVWCAVATFVIMMVLKFTIGIRVPEPVEVEGLDVNLHGEVVQ